jgi:hypothetical protein
VPEKNAINITCIKIKEKNQGRRLFYGKGTKGSYGLVKGEKNNVKYSSSHIHITAN